MEKGVVVELKNVTKIFKLFKNDKQRFLSVFSNKIKYKEKVATNNLSLKIKKGETVALFGKNGAGKSTLLKLITGVTFPTEGTVEVKGRVCALLELTTGFDKEFTGRENIYLRGRLLGFSKSEMKKLEPAIVEFADLGDYIDQPVKTYSSGMKARIGFAINANVNPEILIVDEALSVGDKEFREKCQKKIREIVERDDCTLIFVTHSTGQAKQFCKRGIVLQNGQIFFDGSIEDAIVKYDESLDVK